MSIVEWANNTPTYYREQRRWPRRRRTLVYIMQSSITTAARRCFSIGHAVGLYPKTSYQREHVGERESLVHGRAAGCLSPYRFRLFYHCAGVFGGDVWLVGSFVSMCVQILYAGGARTFRWAIIIITTMSIRSSA